MASYVRPTRLEDALVALAERPRTVLAGGTDHYPARAVFEPDEDILDVTGIGGLREIGLEGGVWRIPALATWTDVVGAGLPQVFEGLRQTAVQVGGRQIQNAGTVVGNVCNASPAADGVPALLALDASVELRRVGGVRVVPLGDFVIGPRRTVRAADELVTAVLVPQSEGRSCFLKLGGRRYLVISIAMVAVTLVLDGAGRVARAAVAVGACGPVAVRLPGLEAALVGWAPGEVEVVEGHLAPLRPIDDMRGSAGYRVAAVMELVRRALGGFAARELAA